METDQTVMDTPNGDPLDRIPDNGQPLGAPPGMEPEVPSNDPAQDLLDRIPDTGGPLGPPPGMEPAKEPDTEPAAEPAAEPEAQPAAEPEKIEVIEEPANEPANETEEAKEPEVEEITLKVNGEEFKETVPKGLSEEHKVLMQKGMAGEMAMQKGRSMQDQALQVIKALQANPQKVLEKVGWNFDQMVRDYVQKMASLEAMSPQERQIEEQRIMNENLQAQNQGLIQQQQAAQQQAEDEQAINQFATEINLALDKDPDIKPTYQNVQRAIDIMIEAIDNGFELTSAQAVQIMKKELSDNNLIDANKLTPEQAYELLDDEAKKKFRQLDLEKNSPKNKLVKGSGKKQTQAPTQTGGPLGTRDWEKMTEERLNNL